MSSTPDGPAALHKAQATSSSLAESASDPHATHRSRAFRWVADPDHRGPHLSDLSDADIEQHLRECRACAVAMFAPPMTEDDRIPF